MAEWQTRPLDSVDPVISSTRYAGLMTTDLGPALVTTREQTVLDLAKRDPGCADLDTQQAIAALLPTVDRDVLTRFAADQRMGATRRRLQHLAR